MFNVDFVWSYSDLKRNVLSHKWHELMEEKPSLEMHKVHFRGKISLTLRVFDIVYFLFSVGGNAQHFSCEIFAPTT